MTFVVTVESALKTAGLRLAEPSERRLTLPVHIVHLQGLDRDGRGGDIWTVGVDVVGPLAAADGAMAAHETHLINAIVAFDRSSAMWVDGVGGVSVQATTSTGSAEALVSTITVRGPRT